MPDTYAAKPTAERRSGDEKDLHAEALKRYERGYNRERENIDRAFEDLAFAAGEGQWDQQAKRDRDTQGRPCLVVDKTAQFCRQVTGDMRQMRPSIKVVPVDDRGDKNVADKILPGMIRYIEQRSDAQAAYFNGADSQVTAGLGHWRVITEYARTDTFLQEIGIAAIDDGVSVIWDPDSIIPTRADAKWCFIPVDLSRASFEEQWPDASPDPLSHAEQLFSDWSRGDMVRVAEYWYKKPAKRKLAKLTNGGIDDVTDDPDAEAEAVAMGAQIEVRDDFKVCRALISASSVIEGPDEWPGRYIPVVPVLGEEIKIGGKIVRRGVVRNLKEVQRIYNYTISAQTEVMALQPKAPWIGTRKNFEKYLDQWETANAKNWPFLEYEPDPANGGQQPSRVAPPVSSAGLQELLTVASADMNAVSGIYPAALGAASNETSGKAILARQREGDTGTYIYIDNFSRAIRHTGRILIDLIPHIYDTERTIRIVGEDGKIDLVKINQEVIDPNGDGMATMSLNDVTVGAYDVVVEMGPSYSTKREEARDGMQAFMQSAPQAAPLFVDLFAKMQDWPLAEAIAKRAKLMLPPPIQAMEAQDAGEPPPPPMPPPPPTPEQQIAMQEAQFKQQDAQLKQEASMRQQDIDKLKAEAALASIQNEVLKSELALAQASLQTEQTRLQTAQELTAAPVQEEPQTEAQPDTRIDEIMTTIEGMRQAVLQAVQQIEGVSAAQFEHQGMVNEKLDKLGSRKSPIGFKRTKDGMQLVYDETGGGSRSPIGLKRTKDGMQAIFDEPIPGSIPSQEQ